MTQRDVRLVIKNSGVVNRPLPQSLLPGEAIVNTAEGIVFYSGVTTSTNEWTPAGTGTTANFFEVGSNLYDLRLRNKITTYEGEAGAGLVGKFLSGTTNGFVLADISSIQGVDSYVTGATWNPNQLTLNLNENKPSIGVNISAFSALTITNDLFVLGELTTNDLTITGAGIYNVIADGSNINEIVNWSSLTAHTSTTDRYVTGGTYDNNTALITFSGANSFPIFTVDLSTIDVNDTYITGGTVSYDSDDLNATVTLKRNDNVDIIITGLTDVKTTGATLFGSIVYFDTNKSLSAYTLDLSALDVNDTYSTGGTITQFASNNSNEQIIQITGNDGFTPYNITGLTDTFVTGFTFTPNTLTISQNNGFNLTANIDSIDLSGVLSGVTFDINTTGNITANSFFGNGSNLTGINNFFVTGGTLNSGTLTLNRQDGSVNISGFAQGSGTTNTIPLFTSGSTLGDSIISQSISGITVSGTTRITTVNNGVGDFLTRDSNGVITKRTSSEVLTDIGAQAALDNKVPYTGSTQNVNLGEFGLDTGYIKLDTTPTNTPTTQGTLSWDTDDLTIKTVLNGYVMKIGEDQFYPVKNQSGSNIPKGTAVRFAGTLGASGRLLIAPFIGDGSIPSSFFMGVTAENINNGADGKVLWFGRIRGINTTMYNNGDVLYASTTTAGGYQTTTPQAPNNIVQIAAVINSHPNQGVIFVRPTLGSNINEDEGVLINTPTDKQVLQYDAVSGLWVNGVDLNAATFTVELIDELTVDFYAPADFKINSFTIINGSGTITIEVNDNPYTLGDLVNQGDKITVTTDTQVVINMNVRYE